jgi:hypothetical protein
MATLIKYAQLLDEIDAMVSRHQKRAEAIADGNVTEGNREATDGQGKKIPSQMEEEYAIDQETMTPSATDPSGKGADYSIDGNSGPAVDDTISSLAEKAGKAGNNILAQLYRMLNKKAEGDEESMEKSKEEDEKKDEAPQGEPSDEELAKAILEEADVTEEDQGEMAELGLKTASQRADYLLSKRAGQQAAMQQLQKHAGMQKQAAMVNYRAGQIFADLEASGHFDKQAAYKAGQMLAQLESQGHFDKQASYQAGQMVAELVKAGQLLTPEAVHAEGVALGQQVREMIKEAYEKGRASARQEYGVVKQASADTTESVIMDVLKRRLGQHVNP